MNEQIEVTDEERRAIKKMNEHIEAIYEESRAKRMAKLKKDIKAVIVRYLANHQHEWNDREHPYQELLEVENACDFGEWLDEWNNDQ